MKVWPYAHDISVNARIRKTQWLAWCISHSICVTYVVLSLGTKPSKNVTICPHSLDRSSEEQQVYGDSMTADKSMYMCFQWWMASSMQTTPVQWDCQLFSTNTATASWPQPANEARGWVPKAHAWFKMQIMLSECHLASWCKVSAKPACRSTVTICRFGSITLRSGLARTCGHTATCHWFEGAGTF